MLKDDGARIQSSKAAPMYAPLAMAITVTIPRAKTKMGLDFCFRNPSRTIRAHCHAFSTQMRGWHIGVGFGVRRMFILKMRTTLSRTSRHGCRAISTVGTPYQARLAGPKEYPKGRLSPCRQAMLWAHPVDDLLGS